MKGMIKMKVYKGTDKDMRCYGGFQYELGKTVEDDGAIRCGNKGFHSCVAPFDVLRYFHKNDGARFFEAEADGVIDGLCKKNRDSKIASSKLTLKEEIGFAGLVDAQVEYTKEKVKTGTSGGDDSNLVGGDDSNLVGGDYSNLVGGNHSSLAGGNHSNLVGGDCSDLVGGYYSSLAGGNHSNLVGGDCSDLVGGYYSNLVGGNHSNLVGGYGSNLVGGDDSNLVGGDRSNLVGGDRSNLVGGYRSNLVGGYGSNLVGGYGSNLAGGDRSNLAGDRSALLSCRDGRAKGGLNSVIVLTHWALGDNGYTPVTVKAEVVDGERIKANTWYELRDGEFAEVEDHE